MTPAETAYAAAQGRLPELTGADRAEALAAIQRQRRRDYGEPDDDLFALERRVEAAGC